MACLLNRVDPSRTTVWRYVLTRAIHVITEAAASYPCKAILSRVPQVARIIVFLVLSQTALAWAQIDCRNRLTGPEVLICATPELLQLDQWLGAAYRSALKATSDQRALRTDQRKWLRERDQCSRYDCLEPLYRSRIGELQRFQGEILALSGKPPTRREVSRVCAGLARHIDTNSIDEVLIPVHLTNPDQVTSRALSSVEEAGLSAKNKWPAYHDRAVVYELKFGDKRMPVRLANFWGRQDCRSARMFNLDRYLASDGTDSGRDPGGVTDLETGIALSTAEDRLVALDGRYFVFTGSPQIPRPSMQRRGHPRYTDLPAASGSNRRGSELPDATPQAAGGRLLWPRKPLGPRSFAVAMISPLF